PELLARLVDEEERPPLDAELLPGERHDRGEQDRRLDGGVDQLRRLDEDAEPLELQAIAVRGGGEARDRHAEKEASTPDGEGCSFSRVTGSYAHTPLVWPMLAPAALLLALAVYAWRHRSAPGARPFVLLVLFIVPWAAGAALELAAVDPGTKVFWFWFASVWKPPVGTAALWFAIEYADLGRWLSRRTGTLLALPAAVPFVLLLAPSGRELLSTVFLVEGHVRGQLGPLGRVLTVYGFGLGFAGLAVFLWLFLRSSQHRWPAALCICGHLASRAGYLIDGSDANPFAPMDATMLGGTFTAAMYAVALVAFRMFELVPVARWTLVEQMTDGVVVLDTGWRMVDLNPAAERILQADGERVRGRAARELLPSLPDAGAWPEGAETAPLEIRVGEGAATRHYTLQLGTLRHRGGFRLGYLVVLRDVTERRHEEARMLEHQRALATLQERDRVARELHDSLGQVLGFAKMQAQAARELLSRGDVPRADTHLARLVSVAGDAHADVREFILGTRAAWACIFAKPSTCPR
ncbi:PAS domain-containing protein, partial [bacterium]|nr:PAS domain-containing protein [bacterium]